MEVIRVSLALGLISLVYGYSLDNCGYNKKQWYRAMGWCGHAGSNIYTGDFNGDGFTDLLCHDSIGRVWTSLNKNNGFIATTFHDADYRFCDESEGHDSFNQFLVGDFNGDGRTDMLCHCRKNGEKNSRKFIGGYKKIAVASSIGEFHGVQWEKPMGWCHHPTAQLFVGDFNGDKKDDILCHSTDTGYKWIALTTDTLGFNGGNTWHKNMGWCHHAHSRLYMGDFNGDGLTDMMCSDNIGSKWIAYNHKGQYFINNDWYLAMNWCGENGQSVFMRIADVNGDKKDDMICHSHSGQTWVAYALPQNGFTRAHYSYRGSWCGLGERGFFVGKFDHDDRADIMCHHYHSGQKWILYSECPFVKK